MNTEVVEAFDRWLAGTPEWSHNALLCLRDEIGLGLLVAENAERRADAIDAAAGQMALAQPLMSAAAEILDNRAWPNSYVLARAAAAIETARATQKAAL